MAQVQTTNIASAREGDKIISSIAMSVALVSFGMLFLTLMMGFALFRFTAPVWPGETVRTEIWRDGDDILFRASVPDRSVVVMDGGRACVAGF